jgi:drug/metabolite transporter (DMT)-like permease
LINYLWPALTLVFAIPILRKKAQVWLVFGVFIGFVGVFFATFSGESFSWRTFGENMAVNYLPYVFAFVAAVSWALYSNLSRLWGGQTESGGVPLFLLLSGLVFVSLRVFTPEDTRLTFRSMLELVYMMIFPTALGYVFWDEAMRKGRIILVAAKLRGNMQSRILAWILFIILINTVAGLLFFVVVLSLFVKWPIVSRPGFVLLFVIGILTLSYGLSYYPVRSLKHLLLRRIHWKSPQIVSMFSGYEIIHRSLSSITTKDGLLGILTGLILLLLFVCYGVADFPAQWRPVSNFLLFLLIILIFVEIAWSRMFKERLKPAPRNVSTSSESRKCRSCASRPWLVVLGVAIWLVFFVTLTLAMAGIAFLGIHVYPAP